MSRVSRFSQILSISCAPARMASLGTCLALVACGGSGGSGGSAPSLGSSPPPTNAAPTFVASAPAETVFEGRVIEIRVRDTDDGDNDIVEFDIVQVSGLDAPLLTNTDGEEPSYYFEAPQVANAGATETLIFEATGTDNINPPVTRQISVTVRDDDFPGLPLAHIEPDDRLFAEVFALFNSRKSTRGIQLLSPNGSEAEIGSLARGIDDTFGSYTETIGAIHYHPDDIVLFDPLPYVGVSRPDTNDYIVLSGDRDALEWYTSEDVFDSDDEFVGTRLLLQQSESFIDPCAVAEIEGSGSNFAWIGLRNGGVVVTEIIPVRTQDGTRIGFNQTRLQTLGAGRSLCFLFPTELPQRLNPVSGQSFLFGIIAVDVLNRELFLIGDLYSDGVWEELDIVPLDLAGNPDLQVIDMIASGGPSRVPRFIAVLVSDGLDGGDHRLIVVGQDRDDAEIFQETYQWSGGAPIKLLRGPFAGNSNDERDPADSWDLQDLAVISASATGNVLLRQVIGANSSSSTVPLYAPPVTFSFMAGASNGVTTSYRRDGVESDGSVRYGIVATFPDDRSLRFFELADE